MTPDEFMAAHTMNPDIDRWCPVHGLGDDYCCEPTKGNFYLLRSSFGEEHLMEFLGEWKEIDV